MSEEKTSAAARAKARPSAAFAGLDQSCLQHVLGYQLAQAEIPTSKIFARSIGKPLGLRPVEFTILLLLACCSIVWRHGGWSRASATPVTGVRNSCA
ncbi:MAG: hypothetical protein P8011_14705 [Acidihalobacter sp.]